MDWKPWLDWKTEDIAAELPISGPPCGACKHWAPRRFYVHGRFEGVRCCHAEDMHYDFSCFKPKREAEERGTE